jgi:hypothetical protein
MLPLLIWKLMLSAVTVGELIILTVWVLTTLQPVSHSDNSNTEIVLNTVVSLKIRFGIINVLKYCFNKIF